MHGWRLARAWLRTRSGKCVLIFLTISGVVLFMFTPVWQAYLLRSNPITPDAASGQIFGMTSHGQTVFVRQLDYVIYDVCFSGGVVAGLAGGVGGMIFDEDELRTLPSGLLGLALYVGPPLLVFGALVAVTRGDFLWALLTR